MNILEFLSARVGRRHVRFSQSVHNLTRSVCIVTALFFPVDSVATSKPPDLAARELMKYPTETCVVHVGGTIYNSHTGEPNNSQTFVAVRYPTGLPSPYDTDTTLLTPNPLQSIGNQGVVSYTLSFPSVAIGQDSCGGESPWLLQTETSAITNSGFTNGPSVNQDHPYPLTSSGSTAQVNIGNLAVDTYYDPNLLHIFLPSIDIAEQ